MPIAKTLFNITKMEHYKYNMAECTHSGKWDENMFGRVCQDCGFNTLSNEHGMYDGNKPIEFGEKGRWKIPEPDIKPDEVFKITAPLILEEPTLFMNDIDHVKMFGTKQKKNRKGNNKKYFKRKNK